MKICSSVLKVLDGPNLSMGPQIAAFEKTFCDYTGAKHAIGVNSGTAGLHLCVRASGIQAGDLVLTTPFSFVASTNVHPVRECRPGLCGCGRAYRQYRYSPVLSKPRVTWLRVAKKPKNGCPERGRR